MRDFIKMMRQYASPYKPYLAGAVVLNILSAVFNIFSFTLIIPVLKIIFQMEEASYSFMPWGSGDFKEVLVNNFYWFVAQYMENHGPIVALLVLAGASLVLANPQPDQVTQPPAPQPALTPYPDVNASTERDLRSLIASFPAPVMSFMSGSGMVFVSGQSEAVPYGGMYGRRITLYWQTREGEPLILQSIYPAEALEIMGMGDYHFSGTAGPALFGRSSVRMEDGGNIRIHVQEEGTGLYVLTLPRQLGASLSGIARSIQLFSAE
jgi:hypothetical protein